VTHVCGVRATTKGPDTKYKKNFDKVDDMDSMTAMAQELLVESMTADVEDCKETFGEAACSEQAAALASVNAKVAASQGSGGDDKKGDGSIIIIVIVVGVLVILLAFGAVCFVKSRGGGGGEAPQQRSAFDNPAYGAPAGKANPIFGAQAEGAYGNPQYDNAQFASGGDPNGGYMDVQPNSY